MKLVPLLLLAACAVSPVQESQVTEDIRCPTWGCGTNSPTVGDGLMFDELDSTGVTPNRGGLVIVGAKAADGTPVWPYVSKDNLYTKAVDGSRSYQGYELVGTIIRLKHPTYGIYELLIDGYDKQTLSFWVGEYQTVPAYRFKARRLGESDKMWQYACKYDVLTSDPHWTGVEHHALVFQWDRYDPERKLVTETASDDPWFNIACAATAPAKMHLLRHTRAGSYGNAGTIAYDTTIKQRDTMLKMLTADYCGSGLSFTVDGQPLVYRDNRHWYPYYGYSTQEALWGPDGALCLDTPRRSTTYTREYVNAKCGFDLPTCGPFTGWESRAYVMSASP